jgi:hypothetical protein
MTQWFPPQPAEHQLSSTILHTDSSFLKRQRAISDVDDDNLCDFDDFNCGVQRSVPVDDKDISVDYKKRRAVDLSSESVDRFQSLSPPAACPIPPPTNSHLRNTSTSDGGGLQTINNKFAMLSEALHISERKATEDLKHRSDIREKLATKEKEEREEKLREMANQARLEKHSLSPVTGEKSAQGVNLDKLMSLQQPDGSFQYSTKCCVLIGCSSHVEFETQAAACGLSHEILFNVFILMLLKDNNLHRDAYSRLKAYLKSILVGEFKTTKKIVKRVCKGKFGAV